MAARVDESSPSTRTESNCYYGMHAAQPPIKESDEVKYSGGNQIKAVQLPLWGLNHNGLWEVILAGNLRAVFTRCPWVIKFKVDSINLIQNSMSTGRGGKALLKCTLVRYTTRRLRGDPVPVRSNLNFLFSSPLLYTPALFMIPSRPVLGGGCIEPRECLFSPVWSTIWVG